MGQEKASSFWSRMVRGWLIVIAIFVPVCAFPVYAVASLGYTETKGPFKNWMQVVDLETDGDLDVIVSHTRWEDVDGSWAGIGQWLNRGGGTFELLRDRGTGNYPFGGFAARAGDVDLDGDLDVFTQDFGINLLVDQGGLQGGEPGHFELDGGINAPPAYNQGYRDMGGMIVMGDLNGDGWVDAFVAGCCYGLNPWKSGYEYPNAPSVSWAWINDTEHTRLLTGHILPLDFLDGRPIRQAVFGDLDEDGDLDVFAAVGQPTMGTPVSPGDLVLLNDGSGNLSAYGEPLGKADSTSVALGDVNGDGRLDALVGTSAGANLWINQGSDVESGGPHFAPAEQSFKAARTAGEKLGAMLSATAGRLLGLYLPWGSIRTQAVFLSDLDADGDPDALLARLWWAEIWWNAGQGEFRRSGVRFEYREDTGVAVADFDGDGDQDIFIGRNDDDYQVWWNDGKGLFIADNR
jgi:hypothetical protein